MRPDQPDPCRIGAHGLQAKGEMSTARSADHPAAETAVTQDRLLGGRVLLRQPRDGYRAAIDPVLLAAAVDVRRGGLVLDAGLGAGAAALCLLARRPDVRVIGIEADAAAAALARENAAANGVADRLEVRCATLATGRRDMAAEGLAADAVMTNPPFLAPGAADPSPHPGRRRANVESADLDAWIADCARMLKAKGALTLVHRADRLDDAVVALRHAGLGEVAVLPLWPKPGVPARRVLLRARKGVAGAARLLPGLTLHAPGGGYTAETEAVLRDAASIGWKGSTSPPEAPN